MKNFDNKIKKWLGVLFILGIVYLAISIFILVPYGIKFINRHYVIEPNDLPNFSDVFNSIFVIVNIIMSALISYMIYRLNKNQERYNYNKEIAGPSLILFYTIKFNIMRSVSTFLINHIDDMEDSFYIREIDKKKKDSKDYIRLSKLPKISPEELKEFIPSIIGHIDDENIRIKLYTIFMDIYESYKGENKDIGEKLVYTLNNNLISDKNLVVKNSEQWVYVINSIYKDDWGYLKQDYKELMNILYNMSKSK